MTVPQSSSVKLKPQISTPNRRCAPARRLLQMGDRFPSESCAFARVGNGASARNARGLGPRASGVVGRGLLPCGAAMLRVAASHQFASA